MYIHRLLKKAKVCFILRHHEARDGC